MIFGGVALVAVLVVAGLALKPRLDRLRYASSLFSGAEQYENFSKMDKIMPATVMAASQTPRAFPVGAETVLPETFVHGAKTYTTADFLDLTDTAALLILKDGQIRFEEYFLTGGPDVTWLSMSVAKSFISALIGIAIEEGAITSVNDPATKYAPFLEGSAYDGVRLKDILQMSSGAAWNEDYNDPESDINRLGRIIALGGSLDKFIATIEPDLQPGTYNRYNSSDTQVLGSVLVAATGRPIADYMYEKLWSPMGAEHQAEWLLDSKRMEMAFFGLNATARDYAKLGELYRNAGRMGERQIIPSDWVKASISPDAPHLIPGKRDNADEDFGYGYQWWVLEGDQGEFSAIGVYNQYIYVNPTAGVVIVKLSAYSDYATSDDPSAYLSPETFSLFGKISNSLTE